MHFILIRPLHVNSNATGKDTWGEWQGLGKSTHRTQTSLNLLYISSNENDSKGNLNEMHVGKKPSF
jgi:hypothetical protein